MTWVWNADKPLQMDSQPVAPPSEKPWRLVEISDRNVRLERYAASGRLEYKYLSHADWWEMATLVIDLDEV